MDSQAGALAGNICSNPLHLQAVHDPESSNFREILILASDVGDQSTGMGVAEEPVQFPNIAGSQKQHAGQKVNGGKLESMSVWAGRRAEQEEIAACINMSGPSDGQDIITNMDDVVLDSPTSVENYVIKASTGSTPNEPYAESIPSSNAVNETVSLCNRTCSVDSSTALESSDGNTEVGLCQAIGRDLAMSRPQDAIRLDPDLVRQHWERTPGDGEENPSDSPLSKVLNNDTTPSIDSSQSEPEDFMSRPAVLDVTSSEELILSDIELSGESPSSPATIDVINLDSHVITGSKLKRPKSLEGCLDLDTKASKWTNPNRPQSLRTTPTISTPHFLDELNEAGSAVVELQDSSTEPTQEGRFDSKNLRLSGILQHELRSRASFTSVSSLSTDYSSSLATDDLSETRESLEPGFVEVNLHSQLSGGEHWAYGAQGAKPKKRGLAGFLARNLFPWKSSGKAAVDQADSPASSGWKLFNRSPAKQAPYPTNQFDINYPPKGKTHPPTLSPNWKKKQAGMRPATSTTALILENRPQNLPAKNPDEEQKHKEQYEVMVKGAKQKEIKVYKQQMKKLAKQLKYEEGIKTLLHVWQTEILKNWDHSKTSKKTREMWWQGIPPSIRGRVWMLAIGNELNITPELFEIFLARAKDRIKVFSEPDTEDAEEVHEASREDSVDVIRLDVSRTFPHLCIYQKGGPYFDRLHSVLGAYACYRPDIGYVQGMSFIAAVFLLYLEPADAFCCFANVLNKSCQLAFFRLDQPVMQSYFDTYEEYFEDNLPDLYHHFKSQCLTPDLYIIDWMYTLYSKSLPLDVACRFLDIFFRDGEEFIFRTALGILHLYEEILISLEFIQLAQFLTKIPEDIQCELLFKSIDVIDIHQKKFSQVLAAHMTSNSHN